MVSFRSACLLFIAAGLAACGPGTDGNSVRVAFAQRPAVRQSTAPVAFRLPATAGTPVKLYRLPRFDEISRRFDTPGFTAARVIAFSDDDDQVYVLSIRGSMLALDLGTGRSRTIDSGIVAATGGPDGAPYVTHADSSVAVVEHRVPKRWPTKLPSPPVALLGAGRGLLLVEAHNGENRELIAASASHPPVRQPMPEGPAVASHWADLVAVGTDSGVVILDPLNAQLPRFVALRARPVAVAFSPSGHRVYALHGNSLSVIDRFSGDVRDEPVLPGVGEDLRPDPFGRLLLVRPARGDSVWIVDAATNRYAATVRGSWNWDLPTVAPDGTVLTRQGADLMALAGDSLTPTGRIRGTPNDRWLAVAWDPRGPVIELGDQVSQAPDSGSVLYVQVSYSLNEAWAQDLAQDLRRAGLNASVLPPSTPDDGYRVVLGPYPTREAAEDAGRKLGRSYWVFSPNQPPPAQ